MGDTKQSTTFPTPPPFYKHFTAANLQSLQKQRQQQSIEQPDTASTVADDPQLSSELRYLVPPAPPADGRWRTFGFQHDLNAPTPTLDEAGIVTLYPDHPTIKLAPQAYLIALARSLLATFLSTVGVLAQNPGLYEQRIKNLRDMVFNMHDLINQYRPHQARESLILMMEERIDQLRQEINTIGELKGKMERSMNEIHQARDVRIDSHEEVVKTLNQIAKIDARKTRQETAWSMLGGLTTKHEIKPEDAELG